MNTRILAALLLAAATGCIDNYASIRLSAACFPPTPNDDGSCSYPSTCESVMMGNLSVDTTYVNTGGTLYWPFQADNQRPPNDVREGAVNTATAFITGFKISYISDSVTIPDAVLDDTTRTVEPESSNVLSIPVIPLPVATLLSVPDDLVAQVRAEIRATGHYGDDSSFETGAFTVVVDVVNENWIGLSYAKPTEIPLGYCPQPGQTGVLLCGAP